MEMINVNSDSATLSWIDFLLNQNLLVLHLKKGKHADPSPISLVTQFITNAERWANVAENTTVTMPQSDDETLAKNARLRQYKTRSLKLMAMQTMAYLEWDLDEIATLPISLQNSLMLAIVGLCEEIQGKNLFLESLYHRWVLRTIQAQKSYKGYNGRPAVGIQHQEALQAADIVLKSLSSQKSVDYIRAVLSVPLHKPVLVPNVETFQSKDPHWHLGNAIESTDFEAILHFDLGVFELYEGSREEATGHFRHLRPSVTSLKYLKLSVAKFDGFQRAVGLKEDANPSVVDKQMNLPTISNSDVLRMANLLRTGKVDEILTHFGAESGYTNGNNDMEDDIRPLDLEQIPVETTHVAAQDQWDLYRCEKLLLESSDFHQIRELVLRINNTGQGHTSIPKLFSDWDLPVPIQHAIENMPNHKDFFHVLFIKSKQALDLKSYNQARNALVFAQQELNEYLQSGTYFNSSQQYHMGKLMQMIDWEILLVDIACYSQDGRNVHQLPNLKQRCKECIRFLDDPASEVNPRSDVVESAITTLINLNEFVFVAQFDEKQKRWPFLEFLGLVARVCRDFSNGVEISPVYRELWNAVLPVCVSTSSMKSQRLMGKEGLVSNRSSLMWVLDRACSKTLITVFISLLSRLHNHILDDGGLQIQAELIQVWPNIIDDVLATTGLEMKGRSSSSSKLNIRQVQDYLLHILQIALSRSDEMLWLKTLGDVYLASGNPSLAMKCYVEHLATSSEFFERHNAPCWLDHALFCKMIKCCETLQYYTQAMILCQFLPIVDYTVAFGMAQEKVTLDGSDALYGFLWDLTILEFLVNLHTKRNEFKKRQEAIRLLGLLELNSNNNEEIQREAMNLRKSQFMRTLAKMYIFVS